MQQKSAYQLETAYSYFIIGSSKHNGYIAEIERELLASLNGTGKPVGTPPLDVPAKDSMELSRLGWDKIERADVIIVANQNGYVGASTFGELCVALKLGKEVRLAHPPSTNSVGYAELAAWSLPLWRPNT